MSAEFDTLLRTARNGTCRSLMARIAATERMQAEHRAAGRGVEAAACAIRLQALREALGDFEGELTPPLRAFVHRTFYSTRRP